MVNKLKDIWKYRRAFLDKRTPLLAKALVVGALAYVILPFDIMPDFIPFAGIIDDAAVLPFLMWLALKFVPKSVISDITASRRG